jgi:hypothetical protein
MSKNDGRSREVQKLAQTKLEILMALCVGVFFFAPMLIGMPILTLSNPNANFVSRTVYHLSGWMLLQQICTVPIYFWQPESELLPNFLLYRGLLAIQCIMTGAQCVINIWLLSYQGDQKQTRPYSRTFPSNYFELTLADANWLTIRSDSEYGWSKGLQFFSGIFSSLLFGIGFTSGLGIVTLWVYDWFRRRRLMKKPIYSRIGQILKSHCLKLNHDGNTYNWNCRWGYGFIRYLRRDRKSEPIKSTVVQVRTEMKACLQFLQSDVYARSLLTDDHYVMLVCGAISTFFCKNIRIRMKPAPVVAVVQPATVSPALIRNNPPVANLYVRIPPLAANNRVRVAGLHSVALPRQGTLSAGVQTPPSPNQIHPVVRVPSRRASAHAIDRQASQTNNSRGNALLATDPQQIEENTGLPQHINGVGEIPDENHNAGQSAPNPGPARLEIANQPQTEDPAQPARAQANAAAPAQPARAQANAAALAQPAPPQANAAAPAQPAAAPKQPNLALLCCQVCGESAEATIELPCTHRYHLECLRSRLYWGQNYCWTGTCVNGKKDFIKMILDASLVD